jgi:hypothetical protein
MNRAARWLIAIGVVVSATALFFTIIGVFGITVSLAGLLAFIVLALVMAGRAQLTEPPQ